MKLNRRSLIIGTLVIIGVVLLVFVIIGIAKGNKEAENNKTVNKVVENKTANETKENTTTNTTEKKTNEDKEFERVYITLDEKLEHKRIDEILKLEFAGQTETYGENMYTYNANIYINDEMVENRIFNFLTTRVIYSSNHDSEFYVDRIDDVYIIVSHMKKTQDGYYVIFVNTDGEVLDEFNDVTLTVKDKAVMISLEAPLSEDERIYTNFTIDGKSLGVKYEKVVKKER